MLSKFNKNCILTGYVDHYCLACELLMTSDTQVGFHIRNVAHIEKLTKTFYVTKYPKDFIRKVPLGYYCELCNILLYSSIVLPSHIEGEDHVLNKSYSHIERMPNWISIKQVDNFIIAFDDILLTKSAWNAVIEDSCCLCNKELADVVQHYNEQMHILKLIQSVLQVDFNNNVYRKIDHHHFHCLTCNSFLPETAFLGHFLSYGHKSMRLKCRMARRSYQNIVLNSDNSTFTTFVGTYPEVESVIAYGIKEVIDDTLEPTSEETKLLANIADILTETNETIPEAKHNENSTELGYLGSPVCKRYKNGVDDLSTDFAPQSFSSQNDDSVHLSSKEPQSLKNDDNKEEESSTLNNNNEPQSVPDLAATNESIQNSHMTISKRSRSSGNVQCSRKLQKNVTNKKKSKTVTELTSKGNVPSNQDKCENMTVNTKIPTKNVSLNQNKSENVNADTKLPKNNVSLNQNKSENVNANIKVPTNNIPLNQNKSENVNANIKVPTNNVPLNQNKSENVNANIKVPTNNVPLNQNKSENVNANIEVPTNNVPLNQNKSENVNANIKVPTNNVPLNQNKSENVNANIKVPTNNVPLNQNKSENVNANMKVSKNNVPFSQNKFENVDANIKVPKNNVPLNQNKFENVNANMKVSKNNGPLSQNKSENVDANIKVPKKNVPLSQNKSENVNANIKVPKNNVPSKQNKSENVIANTKVSKNNVPFNQVDKENVKINTKISNRDNKLSGSTRSIKAKKEYDLNKVFQTNDFIYGKLNLDNYSCLLCHTELGEENPRIHINSAHHQNLLKLRNDVTRKINHNKKDGGAAGNIVIEDWSEDELESDIQETPDTKITSITFESSKNKTPKNSVNDINEELNAQLYDLKEFAMKNDMTYSGHHTSFCLLCLVDIPNNIKNFTEHANGVKHRRSLSLKKSVGNLEKDEASPDKKEFEKSDESDLSNESEASILSIKHYKTQPLSEFMNTITTIETKYRQDLVVNEKVCIDVTSFCMWQFVKDTITCYACDVEFDYDASVGHLKSKGHLKALTNTQVVTSFPREFIREIRENVFHCGFCNLICDAWDILQQHLNSDRHQTRKINFTWHLQEHVYCIRNSVVKRAKMSIDMFIDKICKQC